MIPFYVGEGEFSNQRNQRLLIIEEKLNHKVITSLMLRTFSSADEIFLIMKSLFVRFLKCSLPLKDGPGFSNVCIYVVFWLLKINLEMERISGQKS